MYKIDATPTDLGTAASKLPLKGNVYRQHVTLTVLFKGVIITLLGKRFFAFQALLNLPWKPISNQFGQRDPPPCSNVVVEDLVFKLLCPPLSAAVVALTKWRGGEQIQHERGPTL